ncbi:MAG: shikimate kinase [Deltaproteobacteria bacterium]|nr:shikimate kinase [Deltaproteobacteria bacterium]
MGSGKSSVGRLLAQSLGLPFIDLDEVIVAAAGKTINAVFAEEGEPAFRALESACLERVLEGARGVIATGGGAVVAEQNRRLMQRYGTVINLTASLPRLLERLSGSEDRPLYAGERPEERMRRLLEEREQFYAAADIRIDTDAKSVEDVAAEILRYLKGLPA